jgi:Skp family chaperone for outer membrane proteins
MTRKNILGIGLASVALAAAGLGFVSGPATAGEGEGKKAEHASVKVGTYNPREVFSQYPGRQAMMQSMKDVQGKMQKARKDGNQEKVMQLQKKMRAQRKKAIDKFQGEVDKTLPKVAKKEGLDLVVVDVVYKADKVATKDITDAVIKEMGGTPQKKKNPMQQMQQKKGGGKGQGKR